MSEEFVRRDPERSWCVCYQAAAEQSDDCNTFTVTVGRYVWIIDELGKWKILTPSAGRKKVVVGVVADVLVRLLKWQTRTMLEPDFNLRGNRLLPAQTSETRADPSRSQSTQGARLLLMHEFINYDFYIHWRMDHASDAHFSHGQWSSQCYFCTDLVEI